MNTTDRIKESIALSEKHSFKTVVIDIDDAREVTGSKWNLVNLVPEYDKYLLIYNNEGNMYVEYFWAMDWEMFVGINKATHWMYLPEAPEVEK
jgi:hypothetical protein